MNFQFLIVLSLACASSAQYYYSRPLSAYGNYQADTPMATGRSMGMKPMTGNQMTQSQSQLRNQVAAAAAAAAGRVQGHKVTAPVMVEEQRIVATTAAPIVATTERGLSTEENPCTAEVLRSTEIQAFTDPLDASSYIVCTDIDVFVRMPCATGTVFNSEIKHCVPKGWVKPVCPVGLCQNQGDCIVDEIKNEYKCLCRVGFTGLFCETNIDECALEGNQVCAKAGGKCVDQINAWYCDFGATIGLSAEEAIERPCTLKDLAEERQFFELPCESRNAYLQCIGENSFLVSRCADMLFWNQELRTCTIEKPAKKTGVCKTLPCKNNGICEDLGDFNFRCTCPAGFTGALCEEPINMCLDAPCGSGRCVPYPGGYNCMCANKIVDKSCDMPIMNPCTEVLEHHSHPMLKEKYLSCGLDGLAFVKSCALTTFWDNLQKACVAPIVPIVAPKPPRMSIFDRPATLEVKTGSMSASLPVTTGSMSASLPVKTGSMSASLPVKTGSMSASLPVRTGSMSASLPVRTGSMSASFQSKVGSKASFQSKIGSKASLPVKTGSMMGSYPGY